MEKEKIVFIDSDGTIMDSMRVKHEVAFAPSVVEVFNLRDYQQLVFDKWNEENLYQEKRGCNRFDGLLSILQYVNENIKTIDNLYIYKFWVENTKRKTLNSLIEYQNLIGGNCLDIFIKWGNIVSRKLDIVEELIRPFSYSQNVLAEMSSKYKVILVSGVTKDLVLEEWGKYGLLDYVDEICTQENGLKENCIKEMLEKYPCSDAIMIGDSMGDYKASKSADINFYPIIQNNENSNWRDWLNKYSEIFSKGKIRDIQNALVDKFFGSLRKAC